MNNILTVCIGNICRSAEATARDIADPYRQPSAAFEAAHAAIALGVDQWVLRINLVS